MARSALPQEVRDNTTRPAYQDDNYILGWASVIAQHWPAIVEAFQAGGHEVNQTKSEFWLPGVDDISTADLPPNINIIFETLQRASGGLKVMGAACQGSFESGLGPMQLSTQPAAARLQNADRLAEGIR
jgi:hypothetical protein